MTGPSSGGWRKTSQFHYRSSGLKSKRDRSERLFPNKYPKTWRAGGDSVCCHTYFAVSLVCMTFFFSRVPALPPGRCQFYVYVSIRVRTTAHATCKGELTFCIYKLFFHGVNDFSHFYSYIKPGWSQRAFIYWRSFAFDFPFGCIPAMPPESCKLFACCIWIVRPQSAMLEGTFALGIHIYSI